MVIKGIFMAIPKVFIASTCYDLKYIRSNLKYFIQSMGYEPVLSEDGMIFYNPEGHTNDSCIKEVENCQLFILIIGGRFGGKYKNSEESITNKEYEEAYKHKVPIFTLIEQDVYSEHHLYIKNKNNKDIDYKKIDYPSVDSIAIFEFIDKVRKQSYNNAFQPFSNFNDIEDYIKKQWAGLFFSYLTNKNEENKVYDIIDQILKINEKIEYLSNQILKSTGSIESQTLVEIYGIMMNDPSIKTLIDTGHKLDPLVVLSSTDYMDCSKRLGKAFSIHKEQTNYITTSSGEINSVHYERMKGCFNELKNTINSILVNKGITLEQLQKYIEK
jgi:hypothetical protein